MQEFRSLSRTALTLGITLSVSRVLGTDYETRPPIGKAKCKNFAVCPERHSNVTGYYPRKSAESALSAFYFLSGFVYEAGAMEVLV